jgi:hypothetical protein
MISQMTPHTIQQLLQVFRLFWENHTGGMPLHHSYHEAVRTVAKDHSVTYQTIGDGCRRRLGLTNINDLHEMLSAWVRGEPSALLHQLQRHSDPAIHSEIDKFFSTTTLTVSTKLKPSVMSAPRDESETVSFRLKARDARSLRALAALEGIPVGEFTARVVSLAVQEQMEVVAHRFIKERPVHA